MKLRIEIEVDNAAFEDDEELPRILQSLSERVPWRGREGELSIHDANGNWVGYVRYVPGKIRRPRR